MVVLAIAASSTPAYAGYNMSFCPVCSGGDLITTYECAGSGFSCSSQVSHCDYDDGTCNDPEL
jgi:hypothetical protein